MAVLKSLKMKSKDFVFSAFGNADAEVPGKIVFARFPQPDENFPYANHKSVMDSSFVKNLDGSAKSKEKLVEHIINTMIDNISANRVNYRLFFGECVERIENLAYEGNEIKNTGDFFGLLPAEAAHAIAGEAYAYAREADRFSIDEKKS